MVESTMKIEPLKKSNYDTWKIYMESILIKIGGLDYVLGNKTKPEDEAGCAAWISEDRKAKAEILLAIHPTEIHQFKDCNTSAELWMKIQKTYQSSGPARKATLLKRLLTRKPKKEEEISEYLKEFCNVVDQLKVIKVSVCEDMLVSIILNNLPSEYENFRCAVESRDELIKLDILRIKLIEEEAARKERHEVNDDVLIAKENSNNNDYKKHEKNVKANVYGSIRCYKCNKIGHKAVNCRNSKQIKYVPRMKQNDTSLVANIADECHSIEEWCIDSGCTTHMSSRKEIFHDLKELNGETLRLATNDTANVMGQGSVILHVPTKHSNKRIDVKNVSYVPDLRMNLLSVSKITDKGNKVIFEREKARVIDNNGNLIFIANRVNNLYKLQASQSYSAVESNVCVEKKDWHERLGHLNYNDMKNMSKGKVHGLKMSIDSKMFDCEICIRGKMHRLPFPENVRRRTKPLEIIHTDICGPMEEVSLGGNRYFITFIDDCSRWCVVKFLRYKSEALDAFKEYKAEVENQKNCKIKFLQSDNGKEYINKEFNSYLMKCGIKRRLSAPYTPQQNGVAERKNLSLVETARCLLLDGNLEKQFWAEAVSTACYIRNRCVSKATNGQIPYTLWTGRKPTVSYFRKYGATGFILNKNKNRRKFDDRSMKGVLIGYSENAKAYRMWVAETEKIVVTRDVRFIEETELKESLNEADDYKYYFSIEKDKVNELRKPVQMEISTENKTVQSDEEKADSSVCPNSLESSPINNKGELQEKVKRGRPRIIRTGKPGRPKKLKCDQKDTTKLETTEDVEEEKEEIDCNLSEITMREAMESKDSKEWIEAMKEEYSSLIRNNTWELTRRQPNMKVIGSKMVLTNKLNQDGTLNRHKARIVAKGYNQIKGIDYNETFSPVCRLSTLRLLVAIVVNNDMHTKQLDIKTAYLNGKLEDNIFMEMPENAEKILEEMSKDKDKEIRKKSILMLKDIKSGKNVCKLKKAIYGLKQSGRVWNKTIHEKLIDLGLEQSQYDSCLYYYKEKDGSLAYVMIYVDDIFIASKLISTVNLITEFLKDHFEVKDMGKLNYFLGIEFVFENDSCKLYQKKAINEVIEKYGMDKCKQINTPMEVNLKLQKPTEEEKEMCVNLPYRELIGSLMYIAMATRPDITYSVNYLSQFCNGYGRTHWKAAKRILRYLQGTQNIGIIYKKNNNEELTGYCDADWANDALDRRSYTGYIFTLAGGVISWRSKKQPTVALSSTEAEYMAISDAAKEAVYLGMLLEESARSNKTVKLYSDNQGAQKIARNPVYHSRTKHIDVRHHFIRELVEENKIHLEYLRTEEMVADILTKALNKGKHNYCMSESGMSQ